MLLWICYKQKCKVVSLNLAHPVYPSTTIQHNRPQDTNFISQLNKKHKSNLEFLADRTNDRAYATVLCPAVCRL